MIARSLARTASLLAALLLLSANAPLRAAVESDWFPFDPGPDGPGEASPIDLRFLNERTAGDGGFIQVRNGAFVHAQSGEPVRFWAVNGPPEHLEGEALRQCARMLAKSGVNLVRVHGGYFTPDGQVDLKKVHHALDLVAAMKAEGIYAHFSIYFPLWLTPAADAPWLPGYNGKQHPFAALFFHRDFQELYWKWWAALLTTPDPTNGRRLIDEPAVAGLEMQNEDSLFFWTFSENNLPDPLLRELETQFGSWLSAKYGSLDRAFTEWDAPKLKRDAPEAGRVAFRPLWNIFSQRTRRDQDTAAFLFEVQSRFYRETYAFLRQLGFKGVITASNWSTASPKVFGPLEKLSYGAGDFIDRHGYFSCDHKGPNAEWSIRDGQTYADRSALRFDPEVPGKPKQFVHPAMDPHYADKPSMISETTWNRPNRFRSEAPLYYAVYGALQGSDAIVHFALDGAQWDVKPNFWMQPWTLRSPAMMGQFPAAALIYRRGLVQEGPVVAEVTLAKQDLLHLQGTPLPQDAALDELRLKDVPDTAELKPGQRLDPLLHYAGRAQVRFSDGPGAVKLQDLSHWIDHQAQIVRSATGELKLDYGRGLLTIDAPQAQGASGALARGGTIETHDLRITSPLDLGHVVVVSLDGQPLSSSKRMLLQVMSEEQTSGFETEPLEGGVKKIVHIGHNPWLVKKLAGSVTWKRPDASRLRITALDGNGDRTDGIKRGPVLPLEPTTIYYWVDVTD